MQQLKDYRSKKKSTKKIRQKNSSKKFVKKICRKIRQKIRLKIRQKIKFIKKFVIGIHTIGTLRELKEAQDSLISVNPDHYWGKRMKRMKKD